MNANHLAPKLAEAKQRDCQAAAAQDRMVRMHIDGARIPDRFECARMFIRNIFAPKPAGGVQKQGTGSPS